MNESVVSPRVSFRALFTDVTQDAFITPSKIASFRAELTKAINDLSYEQKVVLSLYHLEGLAVAEMAEVLNKTEIDICQDYLNAVSNLKNKLKSTLFQIEGVNFDRKFV